MLFDKKAIRALLVPLVIEQVLTGLMGVADTVMVSNIGEAAVSGVALVDAINLLVVQFMSALAAGGTIVCAQYMGRRDETDANRASAQVTLAGLVISSALCVALVLLRRPVLRLIFGTVEKDVMDAALTYLLITALSYPFLALYTTSAALFRAVGDARRPMLVAAAADALNIVGNAVLMFVLRWGVTGAAVATLASRVFSAVLMLRWQLRPGLPISLTDVRHIRPDWAMIRRVLRIGLPAAVENGMFQLGRLVVQSTVSVLGTTAIAAQALALTLETFGSMPAQAVGIGLMTVAGQTLGRGREDEARYYIRRFTWISALTVLGTSVLIAGGAPLVVRFTALSADGAALVCRILWVTCAIKVCIWPHAFTLPNGLRAAGDVSYAMWVTTVSMWVFRVALSWILCRHTAVGLWGVWIGWCTDWLVRHICFRVRFHGDRWLRHAVID